MSTLPEVLIHTDGACTGNPGPGGWGVVLRWGDHRRELSGGRRLTTNNRMELLAAVEGLRALKRPCRVTMISDARYVVDGIMKGWARRWRAQGWMRSTSDPAVNADLWALLLDLCERYDVTFQWIRGHNGDVDNERCDRLAVQAAQNDELPPDEGYENRAERETVVNRQPTLFDALDGR